MISPGVRVAGPKTPSFSIDFYDFYIPSHVNAYVCVPGPDSTETGRKL